MFETSKKVTVRLWLGHDSHESIIIHAIFFDSMYKWPFWDGPELPSMELRTLGVSLELITSKHKFGPFRYAPKNYIDGLFSSPFLRTIDGSNIPSSDGFLATRLAWRRRHHLQRDRGSVLNFLKVRQSCSRHYKGCDILHVRWRL